jgi:hypothetical protein
MADERNIKIGITTTADTAGFDRTTAAQNQLLTAQEREVAEVERLIAGARRQKEAQEALADSIERTATEQQDAQRAADLVEAKARAGTRVLAEQGQQVKNLGGFVTQAGFQLTDFAVQVQGGTSAITAFAQQFPQLVGAVTQSGLDLSSVGEDILSMAIDGGTALSIIGTAVAIGVKLAADAYDDMTEAQDNLTEAVKRNAEQAEASAAVTQAKNTGGNVAAAEGNQLAVATANKLAEAKGLLDASTGVAEAAAAELATKNALLDNERQKNDEFSDAFKEANANYKQALDANEAAKLDLQLQQQKYDVALQTISAQTDASLSTLQTGVAAAQTEAAKQTLAILQQKAAAEGGNISSNMQQAIADLSKALADGVVRANESPLVTDAINQMRASREGADQKIVTALTSLTTQQENVLRTVPSLTARIEAMELEFKRMEERAAQ